MEALRGDVTTQVLTANKLRFKSKSFFYFDILSVLDLLTAHGPVMISSWACGLVSNSFCRSRLCSLVGLSSLYR